MSARFELPAGTYTIEASKQGYETKRESVYVSADTDKEITLQPSGQQPPEQPISGRTLLIGAIAAAGLLLLMALLLRREGRRGRRSRREEEEEE
ncbi:MAG: carboxypeptidase-like regulatory domain-containing protein [Acidilobaceae archaeon]|nr:carboxypeptidase-like regulatory domain-containing protein [Acidilobaceae archaeon]